MRPVYYHYESSRAGKVRSGNGSKGGRWGGKQYLLRTFSTLFMFDNGTEGARSAGVQEHHLDARPRLHHQRRLVPLYLLTWTHRLKYISEFLHPLQIKTEIIQKCLKHFCSAEIKQILE